MLKKKPRINLSSNEFARFIENKLLYVDKSMFIKHFIDDPSDVLLITRPRRIGKSMNMNMLAEFLDCKKKSGHLFKGLKIEKSNVFKEHLNKYPVIYLDFKNLSPTYYKSDIRDFLIRIIDKYLLPEQYTKPLKKMVEDEQNLNENNLLLLTENLYLVYKVKPIILIDEYDHLLMDNLHEPDYEKKRNYISLIFEFAFKNNLNLGKAFLTGILRISHESMFSKLNNVFVYDVFEESDFDEDFGLTEKEVKALVAPKDFEMVKEWYNGIHVGNSYVFYIFSVLNFMARGRISNYWGQSGTINLLGDLLTKSKAVNIGEAVKKFGNTFTTELDPRVSLKELFADKEDKYYYALAVQAGYLTWDEIKNDNPEYRLYKLRVPNKELMMVWKEYILSSVVKKEEQNYLARIFEEIDDTETFGEELTKLLSFKLSYFDLHDNLEKTYHGFVLGLMVALGFDVKSNNEAGFGRYDLHVESKKWTAAIEFKISKTAKGIKQSVKDALAQIEKRKYLAHASKKRAAYAIGVGVHKKEALAVCKKVGKL